ncbi:MAG TPA: ABC transporter ATP-binding protein [Kiritimatiellia bacterium]|nr:ABC transporter ATP-binding protein [Kiritimatiellia bacterium]HMO99225.1 ABC transporter ATP-binding protein [Kiritimatiellia bacterium]HMP97487.1 ABC transporter ATP-binding protein [Kiritimatiellia bacterium]
MSGCAIEAKQLCKRFGSVRAACGVSLRVPASRFLALLGASGCGKTTVLRMLAGFVTPDGGSITLGGEVVYDDAVRVPPEKRRLGMVFQEYALFPHMTVAGNIGYGLPPGERRGPRIDEMLELVGLPGLGNRMPHELSGGQQQRVALARALAPEPAAILLDEPFSNLDAALRVRVRTDVRDILRHAGVTAVFVTHDQEEALSLSDEVAVMMNGRIVQTGPPASVYRSPVNREVATFLGDANFLSGQATGRRVQCELGEIITEQPYHGGVEVMLRPEDLALSTYGETQAVIEDLQFFGHDQLVQMRLPSGATLRSRLLGAPGAYQRGQRVAVRVNGPAMIYPVDAAG